MPSKWLSGDDRTIRSRPKLTNSNNKRSSYKQFRFYDYTDLIIQISNDRRTLERRFPNENFIAIDLPFCRGDRIDFIADADEEHSYYAYDSSELFHQLFTIGFYDSGFRSTIGQRPFLEFEMSDAFLDLKNLFQSYLEWTPDDQLRWGSEMDQGYVMPELIKLSKVHLSVSLNQMAHRITIDQPEVLKEYTNVVKHTDVLEPNDHLKSIKDNEESNEK